MAFRIIFSPEAENDLDLIYDHVSGRASDDVALRYVERIEAYCRGFTLFPQRGTRWDDVTPGLRVVGFERRMTIAFHIDADRVVFDRILYGGRSFDPADDEEG